jgi:hypothetical protein
MAEPQYNSLIASLISGAPLNELGPGTPVSAKRADLQKLAPDSLAAPRIPRDRDAANACCAALWLRYNFLDESHRISQEIETADGSYWHGILHRREPDYSNAKYWFRRVGEHAIFSELCAESAQLARQWLAQSSANRAIDETVVALTTQPRWDPMRFVDLCERVACRGTEVETLVREIQRREWDLLFDFCYRKAIAV